MVLRVSPSMRIDPNGKIFSPRKQQEEEDESTFMMTMKSIIKWTVILSLPFFLGTQVCYMREAGIVFEEEISSLPTTQKKLPSKTKTKGTKTKTKKIASAVTARAAADDITNFEKSILEEFPNSRKQKPIVYVCSKDKKDKHFAKMLFPNIGYMVIYYDKAKEGEIQPWSVETATFIMWKDGRDEACAKHPFYEEAIKRKSESTKLNPPVEEEWIDGIHWPAKSTSGMTLLQDRPMIIGCLGEVFYRERYPPLDGIDLTIFRAKVKPRPGSLTYHDIQGVSHSFRRTNSYPSNTSIYTSDQGKEVWTKPYDTFQDNPLRWDEKTNNKGFCTILTGSIFKNLYDLDALVRNSMFRILNEYKPCKKPHPCPGDDLLSYECQSGFKFTVSMENTQLEGYMSEKIFIGKLAGGVPIYFGAPDAAKYVNTDSFVYCNLEPSLIQELNSYYIFDRPNGARYNRLFSMFNNTPVNDMDKEKLLDWAVEYLRPHLQPCVDRVIELDQDIDKYNAIRNEPLIVKPEILTGYASKGLGIAYKYLRTGQFPNNNNTVITIKK